MTCLQLLRHSLACTARQWPLARRRRVRAKTEKGKRVPCRAERVQQMKPQDLAETSCIVIPETPDANSPVHSIHSVPCGPGKVIMGTPLAIGTLKQNTFT